MEILLSMLLSFMVSQLGDSIVSVPAGNANLTVSNYGALLEFRWPGQGANQLFYGSVAVGNNPSYLIDVWYNPAYIDSDFVANAGFFWDSPPPFGDTLAWCEYDDSGYPLPANLYVEEKGFAFSDIENPGCGNGIILRLIIKNQGDSLLNALYAGTLLDLDIGSFDQNQGAQDTLRNLGYMYFSNVYVGITLLEPESNFIGRFIDNNIYVYPGSEPTDTSKFGFLNGSLGLIQTDRADNWSISVSYGPFDLSPGDFQVVMFAIVGGNSLSNLQANVDMLPGCLDIEEENFVQLSPAFNLRHQTFSKNKTVKILFGLSSASEIFLNLLDVSGRIILKIYKGNMGSGVHEILFDTGKIKRGIYFLNLKASERAKTLKLIFIE